MRRWLRLVLYLAVGCMTLGLGLVRLLPWVRVLRGPASLCTDLVSPWPWLLLCVIAILGLLWLVADLGLQLRRMPGWASGVMVGAAMLAALLVSREAPARNEAWSRISEAPPRVQATEALALVAEGLADHYRKVGRYPADAEVLRRQLREKNGQPILSAYRYAAARQRPLAVVQNGGSAPVLKPPPGILPGTILYTLSPGAEAFWLTAVVGEGVPAEARILVTSGGQPVVVSNVPRGWVVPGGSRK